MNYQWLPVNQDSKRDVRIILHPTAPIWEVRRGVYDTGSDDSIDLSDFVTQASHTAFDASVTLSFNRELFGENQPRPNQVLEVQLMQKGEWMPIWIGVIEALNSFTLQRGTRSMQLIAKSRDSQDIWRHSKRITPIYPQMTDIVEIAKRVARSASMKGDEILLPPSGIMTTHSTTQMADMNAWDMITQLFLPLGWTPFIDSVGRLRAASRDLQSRTADIKLEDDRLVKVGGSRQRPPATRVRVLWLDPQMKKHLRQGQLITTETITMGWWAKDYEREFYFSADKTMRAEEVDFRAKPSVNTFGWAKFVDEKFVQTAPNRGKLKFHNKKWLVTYISMGVWLGTHFIPDMTLPHAILPIPIPALPVQVGPTGTGATVPPTFTSKWVTVPTNTVPIGRVAEGAAMAVLISTMLLQGTGNYEIWGKPYDWVHARNTSEAFDSSMPEWIDRVVEIESDFISNEEHARAVAIRELIYQAQEVNKWTVTMVDDPRIEYGDILQFVDGSQLYVEDFSRQLERGSEAILEIRGFLIKPAPKVKLESGIEVPIAPPDSTDGLPPGFEPDNTGGTGGGTGDTGGGGGGGDTGGGGGTGDPNVGLNSKKPQVSLPDMLGNVQQFASSHADLLARSCQTSGGTWEYFDGLVSYLQGIDSRVGYNGKRGGSERSMDAVSYYHQTDTSNMEGSVDVYVIDVIGGHCGSNPGASWNNVTTNAVDGKYFGGR